MSRFTVTFWGVRGSIATSGRDFAEVGGHTSCVEVRAGDERIILDAGTGLVPLGQTFVAPARATFFLSHFHWDHIQGFPFFRPAYERRNRFTLYGPGEDDAGLEAALRRQMEPPHFPVPLGTMKAELVFHRIRSGDEVSVGPVHIRAAELNHPQGCLGFRLSFGGWSVVYATDTEHLGPGIADHGTFDLARGADLLIYDTQYTDDEYDGVNGQVRRGWGHSTVGEACRLAQAAGVKQLALFHHDPTHDDACVDRLVTEARKRFPNVLAAREGLTLDLFRTQLHAKAA